MAAHKVRQRRVGNYSLTATAKNSDGVSVAIGSPATVTIYDSADAVVVDAVSVTVEAGGTLSYAASVDDLAHLDTYRAVWAGTISDVDEEWETYFELVSGYFFELNELRDMDTSYADETTYPDATLEVLRGGVEADFEEEGRCAFVTRGARESLSGDGGTKLFLPHPMVRSILSVSVDGTALTSAELAELVIKDNVLYWEDCWDDGYGNIDVAYTHGYVSAPQPIKEKALLVAADRLVSSDLPANATSQVIDGSSFRIAIANERNPFGDPSVITTIRRWGRSGAFCG